MKEEIMHDQNQNIWRLFRYTHLSEHFCGFQETFADFKAIFYGIGLVPSEKKKKKHELFSPSDL